MHKAAVPQQQIPSTAANKFALLLQHWIVDVDGLKIAGVFAVCKAPELCMRFGDDAKATGGSSAIKQGHQTLLRKYDGT